MAIDMLQNSVIFSLIAYTDILIHCMSFKTWPTDKEAHSYVIIFYILPNIFSEKILGVDSIPEEEL